MKFFVTQGKRVIMDQVESWWPWYDVKDSREGAYKITLKMIHGNHYTFKWDNIESRDLQIERIDAIFGGNGTTESEGQYQGPGEHRM